MAPEVMPLPSRMPRKPSPSWSENIHPFWKPHANPEGHACDRGLAVVDAVLDDDLHALDEEQRNEDQNVGGSYRRGDGDE